MEFAQNRQARHGTFRPVIKQLGQAVPQAKALVERGSMSWKSPYRLKWL
jgi:hypothetical protein